MTTDPHTNLSQATSALKCIADLVGEQEVQLEAINGWRLACLLHLVTDRLTQVLDQLGGDPDDIRRAILQATPPHAAEGH